MARFQREAEVSPRHSTTPNIGHIYGTMVPKTRVGWSSRSFEGPTLADRLEGGPIPLDEAVEITKQIIEALEYAHDRGSSSSRFEACER